MKLMSIISVDLLTPQLVSGLLGQFGVNLSEDMISLFLAAIKQKGYKDLGEVMADKELMDDVLSLASNTYIKRHILNDPDEQGPHTNGGDAEMIHLDTPFGCPKCGEITTLRKYKHRRENRIKKMED